MAGLKRQNPIRKCVERFCPTLPGLERSQSIWCVQYEPRLSGSGPIRRHGRYECIGNALKTSGVFVRAALIVASLALLWVAGCHGPLVEPMDHLKEAGLDEPFPGASGAHWRADFDRLIYDIPRAMEKHHWGMLSIKQVTADGDRLVRASGLLVDGREAKLVAWPSGKNSVAVALRVGRFGDPDQEQAFINRLAEVLRGKIGRLQRRATRYPPP